MVNSAAITVQLKAIRKSYHLQARGALVDSATSNAEVLHGVDLTLARGEFVALIGPSGSGKSTLLNLIGLLDKPSTGEVVITGQATTSLDDNALTALRARAIGFVFQFHNLLAEFTATENVMLPLLAAQGYPNAEMRRRAKLLIDQVGLTAVGDHLSNDLSGGQQQRVAIARALIMQPALVLADEPTGNLDTQAADAIFDLLRQVNETSGTSFLIVTHDPRLAQRCDRIIELVDGNIASDQANVNVRRPHRDLNIASAAHSG